MCSTSYLPRQMKVKTQMRYHCTPSQLRKFKNTMCWVRKWNKWKLPYCAAGSREWHNHLGRASGRYLLKLSARISCDPAVLLLVTSPAKNSWMFASRHMYKYFLSSLVLNSPKLKFWKQSVHQLQNESIVVYISNGILHSNRNE